MSDLCASVDPSDTHGGAREGAGRKAKDADVIQGSNSTLNNDDQPKRQKRDAAYWIARLKRDAATDTLAAALRQKLGRPGGKPPGPDAADNSDRETGQHRACPLKAILDALKVNAGLGEKAWGPAIVGWPFAV